MEENKKEKYLNILFGRQNQQVCLIYGRRRIGKSELIKQALKETDKTSIYYECKQTTEQNNIESISQLLSETFGYPKPSFNSIEELLEFIFNESKERDIILVFDEFSYLREVVKGLDSILQSLIDKYKEISTLKLVLCGSYVDVMKSLLEKENPLYGRIDKIIDLKQMDYYESSMFYSNYSNEDKVKLYSVFGGIPFYNSLIDTSLSVEENIIELIASPNARLESEVSMYLKSEISKINNANEVFETLAKGYSKFSDLLSQSHVSSSPTLVDVLEKLIQMEVVKKETPINDENNKRKAGYYITDNLSLFYYRYIFRHLSQVQVLNSEVFYQRYIKEDFETKYVQHIFENVCKQYLIYQNKQGNIEEPFDKIDKYYYDNPKEKINGEFDIVTEDPNGFIFYEAKFRKEPITEKKVKEEIEHVKATGLNSYRYGFFSKSGFEKENLENVSYYTLDDLYDL